MRNDFYLTTGRIFYGSSVAAIGVIHLVTGNFPMGLLPVVASFPGRDFLIYLSGIAMCIAGILILTKKTPTRVLSWRPLFSWYFYFFCIYQN